MKSKILGSKLNKGGINLIEKELSKLSEIIKYVNDKNMILDKVKLLMEVSVTGAILLNSQISGPVSTAFTLAGISIPPVINSCFDRFKSSPEEELAMNTFKRCQFADFILSRLAVVQAVRNNLRGKERVFADWKISLITDENKTKIERMDQKREENFIDDFFKGVYNKDGYWDELLSSLMEVLELENEKKENFKAKMKEQIYKSYGAFKNHVIYNSKYFEIYNTNSNENEIHKKYRELEEFLRLYGTLYRSIDKFEEWLKASTQPSIGLDFYNYNEELFEKQFIEQLSRRVIYVKGKTREEVLMYVLYIIKNIEKTRKSDTFIVNSIDDWNRLNGHCEGKILIPNFNAAEVNIILKNTCVIAFGEEDFIGEMKNPIELNKRILSNMHDMFYKECDDLDLTNKIIDKTNGLYASFKRLVFQGKTGKPKWEEYAGKQLVPTLLIGKWSERGWREGQEINGDIEAVGKIAGQDYKEYLQLLKKLMGEDPFILSHNGFDGRSYKLSNVEEAWEILFKYISKEMLNDFRELAIIALTEVPPKFKLPVEEHYKAGILPEKPKYSNTIKEGIVRTLIMLANMEGVENNFDEYSIQHYVDKIVMNILEQVDSSEKWFAISEHIQDLVEASPKVILEKLERETSNPEALLWDLFERQSNGGFNGGNYYTYILWALEKLLCFKNYAIPAIKVLAKLAERNLEYKISNSPASTMYKALCPWIHDINVSIEDKINVTRYIVKNSEKGWDILKDLLPNGGHSVVMNLTKPRYRKYKNEYHLENRNQVLDTYKSYTEIAIEQAGNDLSKWRILFEKFSSFQFGLKEKIISGVVAAINDGHSDVQKYELKEQIRDLIHSHRFQIDSDRTLQEPYIARIEKEVFEAIKFENDIFEYLYLFKTDRPSLLHPKPYDRENYNYEEERREVRELRRKTIRNIQANSSLDIIEFIKYLTDEYEYGYGLIEIGEWLAEFHELNIDYDFIDSMIGLKQEIVIRAYIDKIYRKKGIIIIQEFLEHYKESHESLAISLLQLANIDKDFLNLLESYEPEIIQKYWESIRSIRDVKEKETLDLIWSKLLEYRNYRCALELLHYSLVEDIDKHVELLVKIAVDPGKYRISNHDIYHIKKSFEKIYELNDLNEESCEFILRLEWWYFEVLADQITPKYMMKKLKEKTEFLAQLIQYAYKTSDEVGKEIALDENRKALSHQAFEILFKLKFCPCVDNNEDILVDELRAWTKRFLELVDQNKQSKVGRQILGECFSKSPIDKDGTYPHIAVRIIFEEYYSKDLQSGFRMGIVNSRGVYTVTNGEVERNISEKYQRYSDETKIEYPRISETLRGLAEEYLINSVEEREQAVYER